MSLVRSESLPQVSFGASDLCLKRPRLPQEHITSITGVLGNTNPTVALMLF